MPTNRAYWILEQFANPMNWFSRCGTGVRRPPGRGTVHGYPCRRGTTFQLGDHEALLWTQGNLPEVAGDKDYYKEGKGFRNRCF